MTIKQGIRHIVTIAVLIVAGTANAQPDKDYMSPALRAEVEQLKKDFTSKTSNASAKFVRKDVPMRGMHGGFRGAHGALAFRLEEGTLKQGETFTVTYGDKSSGN